MNNTIKRTYDILEYISTSGDKGFSLAEIVSHLKLPKSSVFDIVKSLCELKLLSTSSHNEKKYVLGLSCYTLGSKYSQNKELFQLAEKYLAPIADFYEKTAFVGLLDNSEIVYIYKYTGKNAKLATCKIGTKHSAYTTALGKSYMSFIDEKQLSNMLDEIVFQNLTEYTVKNKESLLNQIKQIRKNGYAIDDKENEVLRTCYAAPIFDATNKPIAAISLSDIKNENYSDERMGEIVRECALSISRELGYSKKQYWLE